MNTLIMKSFKIQNILIKNIEIEFYVTQSVEKEKK